MSLTGLMCRACLQISEETKHLHNFHSLRTTFIELTLLDISDDDHLPKHLCSKCSELLGQFKTFKNTCIESDFQLRRDLIKEEIVTSELKVEPIFTTEDENENGTQFGHNKRKQKLQHISNDEADLENKGILNLHQRSNKKKRNEKYGEVNLENSVQRKKRYGKSQKSEVNSYKLDFKCSYNGCRSMFKTQERLDNHWRIHKGLPLNTCDICSKIFSSARVLKIHRETHLLPDKKFICDYCKKEFTLKRRLLSHIGRHVSSLSFVCEMCGKAYHTMSALTQHKYLHNEDWKFKCEQCDKLFKTGVNLCSHRAYCHSTENFICKICNRIFRSKGGLRKHCKNVHTAYTIEENLFPCNLCDIKCKSKRSLVNHQKLHTGERKYACTLCPKRFAHRELLKRHGYFHSGERPVHCDVCDKGFYIKSALDTHMNIHKRQWIAEGVQGITLYQYPRNKKATLKNITDHEFA